MDVDTLREGVETADSLEENIVDLEEKSNDLHLIYD